MGVDTRIDTKQIMSTSRLVAQVTGLHVQASKPIVGRNAFAHESGIHQHGMLKDRRTYEIMTPEAVGLTESKIILGKHSGRAALQKRLEELGFAMSKTQLDKVFDRFKQLADRKKNIYDEDLTTLVADDVYDVPARYELLHVEAKSGTDAEPWARVSVRYEGKEHVAEANGNGPVSATVEALKRATDNTEVAMLEYHIDALSGGSDAQAAVRLSIESNGRVSHGRATYTDVVLASAQAFIAALNHKAFQGEMLRRSAVSA
jgi:2-isopropylmalate synthase